MPEGGAFSVADWLWRVPQGFTNFLPWTVLLPLLWSPRVLPCLALGGRREVALFRGMRWGMAATFLCISLLPGGSARYAYPLVTIPCLLLARVLAIKAGSEVSPVPLPGWLPTAWGEVNVVLGGVVTAAALVMPLLVPAGLTRVVAATAGGVILAAAIIWRPRLADGSYPVVGSALASAGVMITITVVYATGVVPFLNAFSAPDPREVAATIRRKLSDRRWKHVPAPHPREVAAAIRRGAPFPQTIAVLDAGYESFWYYLEPGVVYCHRFQDLPRNTRVSLYLVPNNWVGRFTIEAATGGVALTPLPLRTDGDRHVFLALGYTLLSVANPGGPAPGPSVFEN